jgi:hypothetical protein
MISHDEALQPPFLTGLVADMIRRGRRVSPVFHDLLNMIQQQNVSFQLLRGVQIVEEALTDAPGDGKSPVGEFPFSVAKQQI